jgi:2'-5' RNA ligase
MPSSVHRIFFAVVPDAAATRAIEDLAADLRARKVVGGRWTAPEKYHATVRFLGDHTEPESLIEKARAAAASVRLAPFALTFERVSTFGGRFQAPCVLRCSPESERALESLWSALGSALDAHGVESEHERRFLPHLTIAYADRRLVQPVRFDPITSPISEFVLVDSRIGSGGHTVIGRWPLAEGGGARRALA